ncbi:MAG: replication initiation factor domain-containing protein [Phycisphaerales bacterium]|jgi:hypothetical protein|nr:replication initiation factor domain-containing protein [Phycisphaerales bacterium]
MPEPGVEIGLDWIRCTGDEELYEKLKNYLWSWLGPHDRAGRGAMYFREGEWWDPGICLSRGHKDRICMIDVQGARLRTMRADDRVALLRVLLEMGMKATRIDGALDFIGQRLDLHRHALASCRAGELCVARSYGEHDRFSADGTPLRLHLSIGARDSPTCSRIYDKGLEQSVAPPGVWERLEVEWKQHNASVVATNLVTAGDRSRWMLLEFILGAFDFREPNGRSELDRRARSDWWERIVGTVQTARPAPARKDESFEKWLAWLQRCICPRLLEFSQAAHITPEALLTRMLVGVEPSTTGGQLVAGCVEWLHSHAGPIAGEQGSHGPSHPVPGTT